jgi:hypothetical protein
MANTVTVKDREIMKVGKYDLSTGDFECTPELISAAVEAHKAGVLRKPVIRLGHNDPRFSGDPAVGWVDNVRASEDGQTLYGDLVGVPKWLADNMPSAYPSLSIEGMHDYTAPDGSGHSFILTGLALLGATAPGISDLKSVQDIFDADPVAAAIGEIGGTPVKFTVNAADAAAKKFGIEINAASQAADKKGAVMASQREKLAAFLGLDASADDEAVDSALDKAIEERDGAEPPAEGAPPAPEPVDQPEPVAAAASSVEQVKTVAAQHGLTVVDASVLQQLQVQAAAGEQARAQQVRESDERTLADALKSGKITAASAPKFREKFTKGGDTRDTALTLLAALPENRAMATIEAGHGVASEDAGFDTELEQISAFVTGGAHAGKDA